MHNRNHRRRTFGWVIAGSAAAGVLLAGYYLASPRPAHLASAAQVQGSLPWAWTPAAGGAPTGGAPGVQGWGRGGYPMMGGGGAVNAPAGGASATTEVASQNWAGYAVTGAAGSFTSVSASWAQPAVTCGATDTFSSFWAGLDGDGTQTVEQTGTEADCSGGAATYQGWYEVFPNAPVFYASPVQPGDAMSASVTSDGNDVFTLTLSDATQDWTQTTQQTAAGAQLGSAEVIAEAPSEATVLPLADFGTVNFADATVDNAPIGAGPNGTTLSELVMQSGSGADLATPSALTGGNAFSVTWDGAGEGDGAGATAAPTPTLTPTPTPTPTPVGTRHHHRHLAADDW
jgi:Peptidase A4 family